MNEKNVLQQHPMEGKVDTNGLLGRKTVLPMNQGHAAECREQGGKLCALRAGPSTMVKWL